MPLLCAYFGFGSPQQQVGMHAKSKNTFIFLYTIIATIMPDLLSDKLTQLSVPTSVSGSPAS